MGRGKCRSWFWPSGSGKTSRWPCLRWVTTSTSSELCLSCRRVRRPILDSSVAASKDLGTGLGFSFPGQIQTKLGHSKAHQNIGFYARAREYNKILSNVQYNQVRFVFFTGL